MARRAIGHYNTLSENRSAGDRAVYSEFGRRLQRRMNEMGWNQTELARRASEHLPRAAKGQVQGHSIGRDQVSSYIRGKYLPRPHVLAALAKALSCEQADLLPPEMVPSVDTKAKEPRHGDTSHMPERVFDLHAVDERHMRITLRTVITNDTAFAIGKLLDADKGKQ